MTLISASLTLTAINSLHEPQNHCVCSNQWRQHGSGARQMQTTANAVPVRLQYHQPSFLLQCQRHAHHWKPLPFLTTFVRTLCLQNWQSTHSDFSFMRCSGTTLAFLLFGFLVEFDVACVGVGVWWPRADMGGCATGCRAIALPSLTPHAAEPSPPAAGAGGGVYGGLLSAVTRGSCVEICG